MSLLLGTKMRGKLLAYSFTHPDENYYVRELSSLIGEDPGNLSRELRKLEEEGLYTSFVKGKAKFYSLNKRYPLFRELKRFVSKTAGVDGSLREVLDKFKGISLAFIYGSYAKGKERVNSDVDLMIIGNVDMDRLDILLGGLEKKLGREINYVLYSMKEFRSKRKAKDGFLMDVLAGDKSMLIGTENGLEAP
jgi:predicted nucleotidyltransferase